MTDRNGPPAPPDPDEGARDPAVPPTPDRDYGDAPGFPDRSFGGPTGNGDDLVPGQSDVDRSYGDAPGFPERSPDEPGSDTTGGA